MNQQDLGLNLNNRRTRKAVFLDEMNLVAPWSELLALIASHAPRTQDVPSAVLTEDDAAHSLRPTLLRIV
jgi:hypothetical protein